MMFVTEIKKVQKVVRGVCTAYMSTNEGQLL